MSDKPEVTATLADLDRAVGDQPKPFVFSPSPNKGRITFPDPGGMDWLEAEEFLANLDPNSRNSEVFKRWLTADDYQRLCTWKLSLAQVMALTRLVTKHYESIFGTPGEGAGSTAS